ncbi:hypothetical protein RHGRI_005583 [Rhododendron griersonianum]|uniref:Retrotransposon Copia-like N-terminal domain-containing protein n=1 Tax=Rhododendron griersonianum TaxID=479676 RepID=A0AAV6LE20_9ERIC|nr:hypothetical protein RHGRI_005583 [Rhododendron griersonianum]
MATNSTSSSTSTSTVVTLPPSLAFLVSNFHSLVNIKLDGTNYLLWRIQVENVVDANGFYGYLDGSITSPPTQIRDAQGDLTLNPAFSLWRLIDSQLRSCLTASLSQTTLPYVLGLRTAYQVWESLSNRYNSLSETHVQELRDQLYNLSKTSTIDVYIDTIKDITQKLAAAGSPIEDDEIVFRALHGLPKVFNGLRTAVRAVRTRGHRVSFDELVTMMKSEDKQLSRDTPDLDVSNTVLVATHGNQSHNNDFSGSSSSVNPVSQSHIGTSQSQGVGFTQPQGVGFNQLASFNPPPQQHQYFPQQFRPFNRGRGSRGYPKGPCDICGRYNHSTNYCYYRPPNMFSSASSSQWRGYPDFSQSTPWMSPMLSGSYPQNIPVYPTFPSQAPRFPSLFSGQPRHARGFRSSVPSMLPMQGSQSVPPQLNSQPSSAFAGFADSYGMPLNSSGCSSNCALSPSSSGFNGTGSAFHCAYNGNSYNSPATQPWYFDSGATNHITNNMQNLNLEYPQPTAMNEGVLVGNGNTLQVTHTGNGLLPTPHANFQAVKLTMIVGIGLANMQELPNKPVLVFIQYLNSCSIHQTPKLCLMPRNGPSKSIE